MDNFPPIQSSPPPVQKNQEVGKEGSREVGREGNRETVKEVIAPPVPVTPPPAPIFDLSVKAYRKDSFLFTDEEFYALEDLKTELNRTHGLNGTKQNVARCAIGYIVEDYKRHGPASIIVKRLKGGK